MRAKPWCSARPPTARSITPFRNDVNAKHARVRVLEAELATSAAERTAPQNRVNAVIMQLGKVQTTLSQRNTAFLDGITKTQQRMQAMPEIHRDRRGLVVKGARLGFVRPQSRITASKPARRWCN